MTTSITRHVSKSLTNVSSGTKFTWWKTNFNMPVPNIFDNSSTWNRYSGPLSYGGEGTSFDTTGFSPGYELLVYVAVFDWDNNSGSSVSLNENLYTRWIDTDGSTTIVNGATGYNLSTTLGAYSWYEYAYCCNIGIASWEVDSDGTYKVGAHTVGNYSISEQTTDISFSNVPNTTLLGTTKKGYIWVEGNDLCLVNANQWKHTIVGTGIGSSPGATKAGHFWLDTSDNFHWVGSDGHDYQMPWKKKQFASFFSNSSTGTTYAGTTKVGTIWVDNQFGSTHIAYIASDGYKYLCGAGADPYA